MGLLGTTPLDGAAGVHSTRLHQRTRHRMYANTYRIHALQVRQDDVSLVDGFVHESVNMSV